MTHKMKALGLALIAVFAMSAVVASAAQATDGKVTAPKYPLILTGDQDGGLTKLTVGKEVRVVSCTETKYDATITEATTSVTVTPTYGTVAVPCVSAPSNLTTHIRTHNCTYTLTVPDVSLSNLSAELTNCPSTAPIEVEITQTSGAALCVYKVENQGPLTGSHWTNKAEDITLEINVAPTITVVTGTAIACGGAVGSHPAATLAGNSTVKGFEDLESGKKEGSQVAVMIG